MARSACARDASAYSPQRIRDGTLHLVSEAHAGRQFRGVLETYRLRYRTDRGVVFTCGDPATRLPCSVGTGMLLSLGNCVEHGNRVYPQHHGICRLCRMVGARISIRWLAPWVELDPQQSLR